MNDLHFKSGLSDQAHSSLFKLFSSIDASLRPGASALHEFIGRSRLRSTTGFSVVFRYFQLFSPNSSCGVMKKNRSEEIRAIRAIRGRIFAKCSDSEGMQNRVFGFFSVLLSPVQQFFI